MYAKFFDVLYVRLKRNTHLHKHFWNFEAL